MDKISVEELNTNYNKYKKKFVYVEGWYDNEKLSDKNTNLSLFSPKKDYLSIAYTLNKMRRTEYSGRIRVVGMANAAMSVKKNISHIVKLEILDKKGIVSDSFINRKINLSKKLKAEMKIKNKIIILPGWGGNKETWDEFAKLASNDFEIEIIELPCFGDEPCPTEVWGVEEYAEFIKHNLERNPEKNESKDPDGDESNTQAQKQRDPSASPQDLVILGHSFGGQVASYLAANNPQICDKLILSGPAVFRPKKRIRRAIFGAISKVGKWIFRLPILEKFDGDIEKLYRRVSRSADYADTSGIKKDIFTKIIREDLSTEIIKIKIPTLIIWGTKDTYVPVKNAYKLNRLIPNSKLEIIKNGKHGLHIQQPKNLFEIVKKYALNN